MSGNTRFGYPTDVISGSLISLNIMNTGFGMHETHGIVDSTVHIAKWVWGSIPFLDLEVIKIYGILIQSCGRSSL